jgi:coiled-coil domain-containing protein 12
MAKFALSHTKDVLSIAVKKPNWDLKRDLEPKLEKLAKRTRRALVEMLNEKLRSEESSGNLAEAVSKAGN